MCRRFEGAQQYGTNVISKHFSSVSNVVLENEPERLTERSDQLIKRYATKRLFLPLLRQLGHRSDTARHLDTAAASP